MLTNIRIKAFRSIVDQSFPVGSFNVFVGSNDAGKSNILRALNLFFNGLVSPNDHFNFTRDYCNLVQPRKGKAREIEISLTFSIPANFKHKGSVVWKKTWRKESPAAFSDTQTDAETGDAITRRTKTNAWLNAHRFRYVPAVRGPDYFRFLMGEVHDVLAESYESELRKSSGAFIQDLQKHTASISKDISSILAIESKLQLPSDLKTLFEVLDFETAGGVSFRQRGDGIQAFHIPAILKFLAYADKKLSVKGKPSATTIWGYEEPENNLEFSRAYTLAEEMFERSQEIQMFITSHSPAFYHGRTSEYKPTKFSVTHDTSSGTLSKFLDTSNELDSMVGLMPMVAPFVASAASQVAQLTQKLADRSRAHIFVSGKTDKQYLDRAIALFAPKLLKLVSVVSVATEGKDGSKNGGDDALKKMVFAAKTTPTRSKVVVIFDHDAQQETLRTLDLFVVALKRNPSNTCLDRGIENLFDDSLVNTKYYEDRKTNKHYGEEITSKVFLKSKFATDLCSDSSSQSRTHFHRFEEYLKDVQDFIEDK